MKKYILIAGFIVATYLVYRHSNEHRVIPPAANTNSINANSAVSYKNGVYTGSTEDAYYGNVQIQATIQNGKISDITFLDYPNDQGTSRTINNQAMPYLKQEAISAQSANVDIVSGATQTSQAFIKSLQNALVQAQ